MTDFRKAAEEHAASVPWGGGNAASFLAGVSLALEETAKVADGKNPAGAFSSVIRDTIRALHPSHGEKPHE